MTIAYFGRIKKKSSRYSSLYKNVAKLDQLWQMLGSKARCLNILYDRWKISQHLASFQECSLRKFSVFVETYVTLIIRKDGGTAKWWLQFNSYWLINLSLAKFSWKTVVGGKFLKGHTYWNIFNLSGTLTIIPLYQHLPQGKHLYAECQSPESTSRQVPSLENKWSPCHRKSLSSSFY